MLERSADYDAAIVGSDRAILLRAVVDISDPDKRFLPTTGSPQAPWSKPEELYDKNFDAPARYSTLEPGRWLLSGEYDLFPEDYRVPEQMGCQEELLSGVDGTFSTPQIACENFEDMRILQACSVFFSTDPLDGIPVDFSVEVLYQDTAYYTEIVTGNQETQRQLSGFTVHNPTAIRLTVTRWSLPGRRIRVVEIVPGVYEDWDESILDYFYIQQKGDFSCLTLPFGRAEIGMDNKSRRFDPRRKDGVFQSITERQGVELYIGVLLADGREEYKRPGIFYQADGGWKDGRNAMDMRWSLIDIVGLVAQRAFVVPEVLPTTLRGWLQAIVGQLGENFTRRFHADPRYADMPVAADDREAVTGKTCGQILRWACMVTGTWPRAASDGKLTAEPLWNQGAKVDLDNLQSYARMRENDSRAALIFTLSDGMEYVVSGNSTSSANTTRIENPFIHTTAQALTAARMILAQYGGNVYEITGRGNPASEIGDVDTIWLDESNAATARRMSQTFQIRDHALQGCQSTLIQADGSYLWTEFVVLSASGTWKAPPGVLRIRVDIGQAGQGGGRGQDGQQRAAGSSNISFSGYNLAYGENGVDGQGGMIWSGVVDINPEQEFAVNIGQGGAPGEIYGEAGQLGGHTTFGPYTSADGELYPNGYTDIVNGQVFARSGVAVPLAGTGDGGKGGDGGDPGQGHIEWVEHSFQPTPSETRPGTLITGHNTWVQDKPPGPGHPGARGADGFVLIVWEKPGG